MLKFFIALTCASLYQTLATNYTWINLENALVDIGTMHMQELKSGEYDSVFSQDKPTNENECSSRWMRTVKTLNQSTNFIADVEDFRTIVRATEDGGFLLRLSFADMVSLLLDNSKGSQGGEQSQCEVKTFYRSPECVKNRIAQSFGAKDVGSFLAREALIKQLLVVESSFGSVLAKGKPRRGKRSQPQMTLGLEISRFLLVASGLEDKTWTEADVMTDDDPTGELHWFEEETYPKRFLQEEPVGFAYSDEVLAKTPHADKYPDIPSFNMMVMQYYKGKDSEDLLKVARLRNEMLHSYFRRKRQNSEYNVIGPYTRDGTKRVVAVDYYSKEFLTKYMCFRNKSDRFYDSVKLYGQNLFLSDDEARQAAYFVALRQEPSMKTFNGMEFIQVGEMLQISMDRGEARRRAKEFLGDEVGRYVELPFNFRINAKERENAAIDSPNYSPNIWNTDMSPPSKANCEE